MKTVYMDNNATSRVADEVVEAMLPFFGELYGNPSSMHTFGGQVAHAIRDAREQVAALLGCLPDEVFFTSCGTESDNTAIASNLDLDGSRGVRRVALKIRGVEPETLQATHDLVAGIVVADTARHDRFIAEQAADVGEVGRRPPKLLVSGEDVPKHLTQTDDCELAHEASGTRECPWQGVPPRGGEKVIFGQTNGLQDALPLKSCKQTGYSYNRPNKGVRDQGPGFRGQSKVLSYQFAVLS